MSRRIAETLSRVVASQPIDRTAMSVTSGGAHYEAPCEGSLWFAECPRIVAVDHNLRLQPEFIDYTGQRIGNVYVLGFGGRKRWVCRCLCGRYMYRYSKSLKGNPALCEVCNNAARLRSGTPSMLPGMAEREAEASARPKGICTVCGRETVRGALYCKPTCKDKARKFRRWKRTGIPIRKVAQ